MDTVMVQEILLTTDQKIPQVRREGLGSVKESDYSSVISD